MIWHYARKDGSKERQKKAKAFYTKLNQLGKKIQTFVLKNHFKKDYHAAWARDEIKIAVNWEHTVDVYDRHRDPVAQREFGYKVQPPISKFLTPHQLTLIPMISESWDNKFKERE